MPAKAFQKLLTSKLAIVLLVLVIIVFGYIILNNTRPSAKRSSTFGTPLADAYTYMYSSDGVVATTTDIVGKPSTIVEVDAPDTVKFILDLGDKKVESIRTSYDLYLQDNDGRWRKIALQGSSSDSNSQIFPSKADIQKIATKEKDNSKFSQEKERTCPNVKTDCSVYKEVVNDSQHKLYYVEKSSGRLLRDEFYIGGNMATITSYEYKPVTIDIPTDIKTEAAAPSSGSAPANIPDDVKRQIESQQETITPPSSR